MADLNVKRYDSMDVVEYTVSDEKFLPVPETATATFRMKHADGTLLVDSEADIVDAEKGVLSYAFDHADVWRVGNNFAEFAIEYEDGRVKTFPSDGYIKIYTTDVIDVDQEIEAIVKAATLETYIKEIEEAIDYANDAGDYASAQADRFADIESTGLPEHLESRTARLIEFTWDLSQSGVQSITLTDGKMPKVIRFTLGVQNDEKCGTGAWTPEAQFSQAIGAQAGRSHMSDAGLMLARSATTQIRGNVTNVTKDGFDVEWTHTNSSMSGEVRVRALILYHG